ncbi:notchless protein homolog 1 [Caerostris extrusa]|uniref:Notchless protein homolog 1 n=1 Tax=Caerostris extrusa TaxID=172846 RepID=A0AAV4SMG8_CAEEX|nr:notchless protein homolog 1 [Caerostris extrusa]
MHRRYYLCGASTFSCTSVTRCTSSIPGHAEAVISASFSPNSKYLASGSGDTTVRLLGCCKNGLICIWDPRTGKQIGKALFLVIQVGLILFFWEPLHRNGACRHIASASKDCTVRVWDVLMGHTLFVLSSHTGSVTCVRWGENGLIYSGSQDRTIKVFRGSDVRKIFLNLSNSGI